jgi:hypothetical protein
MRFSAALDAAVSTLAVGLLPLAVVLVLSKISAGFSTRHVVDVALAAGLAATGAGIYAAARRLPRFAGARSLDAYHRLSDRLASAISFAELRPEERTRLMDLAIDDACAHAGELSPRRAVPLRRPRDLGVLSGLCAGVMLLIALRPTVLSRPLQAKTIDPVVLSPDDIDLFRSAGQELAEKDKSPDVLAELKAYNQLVEDIAHQRVDRTEAFRRMAEIQERLSEANALDPKSLEQELKVRATELKNSPLSKPLAEALENQDFAKAEQKMRELAQRLRDKPDSVAQADLERLRDAMKKAAEGQQERLAALERTREEMRQDLLQKKAQADGGGSENEQSLLKRQERQLERLDRDKDEKKSEQSRQLDKLDRDIAQAAEDLMREMGMSANDLDQGAEDINRMGQQKMSQQEREELRQKLEELREQLRQSGQGGRERMARIQRFMQQARGKGRGSPSKNCDPGDPSCQQEPGQQGEGQQSGEEQGQGQGQGSGEMLQLGMSSGENGSGQQGSAPPVAAGDPNQGSGEGQGQGQGEGKGPGGKKGKGMSTIDVQAAGLDTGKGASRSEVILGASEKGFRGGAYKKVYTEYRTSAEEQLHKDKIPPGGSDHIRRYFDLIRPRE